MYVNDPIADMLTRVRNANIIYNDSVDVLLDGDQIMAICAGDILDRET